MANTQNELMDFPRYAILQNPVQNDKRKRKKLRTTAYEVDVWRVEGLDGPVAEPDNQDTESVAVKNWEARCLGIYMSKEFAILEAQRILRNGEHKNGLVIAELQNLIKPQPITLDYVDLNENQSPRTPFSPGKSSHMEEVSTRS